MASEWYTQAGAPNPAAWTVTVQPSGQGARVGRTVATGAGGFSAAQPAAVWARSMASRILPSRSSGAYGFWIRSRPSGTSPRSPMASAG